MSISDIAASLHPLERAVLPHLNEQDFDKIVSASKLKDVEVMRALQWLENKDVLKLKETLTEIVDLDKNGKEYANSGLPEFRFLNALTEDPQSVDAISKKAKLSHEEAQKSIGVLKQRSLIELTKSKGLQCHITSAGKKFQNKKSPEDAFLKSLPREMSSLSKDDQELLHQFRKRKSIITVSVKKHRAITITSTGKKLLEQKSSIDNIKDHLTPEMLRTKSWEKNSFRRYDVSAPVPRFFSGKKQPYREFLEEVRTHFLALGFTEMTGPVVETEFWNMDSLFMPQDHSARDIHDAYYIKEPTHATSLPEDMVKKVQAAHENGYTTGSRGWRYKFDVKRTHRHILRTHDTAISPRILSSKELTVPGKYFQLVRCFRYDVIDATHLPDFNQIGGFVVEEGLTLRHLSGLLKMFAKEFCNTDQVRVVPAYFPFTEPSASLYAKHPEMGWIELAGAGMFRPEMNAPLGVKDPVIAWGIGLDRVAMFNLGFKDIRQLFSHDLDFLRQARGI